MGELVNWGSLSNADVIAISSAVIALCALGVSIWQGYLTRRHNVLSARPLIEITVCLAMDEQSGISLKNCGPGPAILQGITVTFDGSRYDLFSEGEIQKLVKVWMTGVSFNASFRTMHPDRQTILASGEASMLWGISRSDNMAALLQHLEGKLDAMQIDVEYQCLYGKAHSSRYCRGTTNAV